MSTTITTQFGNPGRIQYCLLSHLPISNWSINSADLTFSLFFCLSNCLCSSLIISHHTLKMCPDWFSPPLSLLAPQFLCASLKVIDLPSFNLFFNGGKVGVKIKRVYSLFSISDRCLVNIITGFLQRIS